MVRSLKSKIESQSRKALEKLQAQVARNTEAGKYVSESAAYGIINSNAVLIPNTHNSGSLIFKDLDAAKSVRKAFQVSRPNYLEGDGYIKPIQIGMDEPYYEMGVTKECVRDFKREPLIKKGVLVESPAPDDYQAQVAKHYFDHKSGKISEVSAPAFDPAIQQKAEQEKQESASEHVNKALSEHAAIVYSGGDQASLFFTDAKIRDELYEKLKTMGQVSMDPWGRGYAIEARDYTPNERPLYEIPVKRAFAERLAETNVVPAERVGNWGQDVGHKEKIITALRIFRTRSERQSVTDEGLIGMCMAGSKVGMLADGRVGLYFEHRAQAEEVSKLLYKYQPDWLSENFKGHKTWSAYNTKSGEIYELIVSEKLAEKILNDAGLDPANMLANGYPLSPVDITRELYAIYGEAERIKPAPAVQEVAKKPEAANNNEAEIAIPAAAIIAAAGATHSNGSKATVETPKEAPVSITPPFSGNGKHKPDHTPKPRFTTQPTEESIMEQAASKSSTNEEIELPDEYIKYAAYLESFGFALKERREERELSRDELAEVASQSVSASEVITADDIKFWEQARGGMPTQGQFEALATILIDENEHITDKAQARADFLDAYQRTVDARAGSENTHDDDLYAFADKLCDLRDKCVVENASLTRDRFAAVLEEKLKVPIPEDEMQLLHEHKGKFIAGIEAGIIKPSKPLVLAMVKAIDQENHLSEDQKKELYDKFEAMPDPKKQLHPTLARHADGHLTLATSNGVGENNGVVSTLKDRSKITRGPGRLGGTRRGKTWGDEEPEDSILSLKYRISKIINPEDLNNNQMAKTLGLNSTTLASIARENHNNPFNVGGFSQNTHDKIVEHIKKKYPENAESIVTEFEALFETLRQEADTVRKNGMTTDGEAVEISSPSPRAANRSKAWGEEEPEDPILKLKFAISKIINPDDLPNAHTARETGLNNQTVASIATQSNADPFKFGGFSPRTHDMLVDYIKKSYPDDSDTKVEQFNKLFDALKVASNQQRKQTELL